MSHRRFAFGVRMRSGGPGPGGPPDPRLTGVRRPPCLDTREPAGRPASGGNSNGADRSRGESTHALSSTASAARPSEHSEGGLVTKRAGGGVRKRRHHCRRALLPRNEALPLNSERVPPFTALTNRFAIRSHTRNLRFLGTLTRREASRSHLAGTEFLRTHRKSLISETPERLAFWGRA